MQHPNGRGRGSRGQGFVERALITPLVALPAVLALALLGPQVAAVFPQASSGA